jgi:hypothetical protein
VRLTGETGHSIASLVNPKFRVVLFGFLKVQPLDELMCVP